MVYGGNRNAENGSRSSGHSGKQNGGYAASAVIKAIEIPADYLEQAENLMHQYYNKISTSKLRRIYSLATEIYNVECRRTDARLLADSVAAIGMMRVRIAYEAGRDKDVKNFVEQVHLLEYLKGIDGNRAQFIKLTQYMEALVAYHKFFGGKEN